ncbi:MAG TPA: nitrile hydratase subunit alpha, partial [Rhizomicrobium sp.]
MSADLDHPHTERHDHDHGQEPPSATALRVKALESLLIEKGLVDPAALDAIIDYYETKVGPRNGARVVARAWTDPAYRARLIANAAAAIAELGYSGTQGEHMVAVENTPAVHNMVVCTLCSCYPWPVLGLPPNWYKSHAYRSLRGHRTARRPARVRPRPARFRRGARLGFDRRDSLPRLAGTSRRQREHERRTTRRTGYARYHDRHGPGARAMNGVHDMGGMHGLPPLVIEPNEPVFHEAWEARIYALSGAAGAWRRWNIDAGRHQQERMQAADYLRASYYERWLFALTENAVRHGLVTREEVESGRPAPGAPKLTPPLQAS